MFKIPLIFIFLFVPFGEAVYFNWQQGQGELELIQFANDCDFALDDLYNKSASSGDECARFCRDEEQCTHFTYSTFYGKGLCFVKNTKRLQKDATKVSGYNAVCGLDCMTAVCEGFGQALDFNWKQGQGELELIQFANDCDFARDDLYNKSASSGDECARLCRDEKRCTHFTYSTFYGKGLCFVKNTKRLQKDATSVPGYNAVCGLDCMTAVCEPLWNPLDGLDDIQIAESCYFYHEAYSSEAISSLKECAQLCRNDKQCSHFTYSEDELAKNSPTYNKSLFHIGICDKLNLEEPGVGLDSGYICGRDCYRAYCKINPNPEVLGPKDEVIVKDHHVVDAIPEKIDDDITSGAYDDEPIDEGKTSISHRTP